LGEEVPIAWVRFLGDPLVGGVLTTWFCLLGEATSLALVVPFCFLGDPLPNIPGRFGDLVGDDALLGDIPSTRDFFLGDPLPDAVSVGEALRLDKIVASELQLGGEARCFLCGEIPIIVWLRNRGDPVPDAGISLCTFGDFIPDSGMAAARLRSLGDPVLDSGTAAARLCSFGDPVPDCGKMLRSLGDSVPDSGKMLRSLGDPAPDSCRGPGSFGDPVPDAIMGE
jgi:hypothetical protein